MEVNSTDVQLLAERLEGAIEGYASTLDLMWPVRLPVSENALEVLLRIARGTRLEPWRTNLREFGGKGGKWLDV